MVVDVIFTRFVVIDIIFVCLHLLLLTLFSSIPQDANGRIGLLPDGTISFAPVEIMQGYEVKKIVSGTDHLACLTTDGDIYTLGTYKVASFILISQCFYFKDFLHTLQ